MAPRPCPAPVARSQLCLQLSLPLRLGGALVTLFSWWLPTLAQGARAWVPQHPSFSEHPTPWPSFTHPPVSTGWPLPAPSAWPELAIQQEAGQTENGI